jgi:hypothetical protein
VVHLPRISAAKAAKEKDCVFVTKISVCARTNWLGATAGPSIRLV